MHQSLEIQALVSGSEVAIPKTMVELSVFEKIQQQGK